MKERILEVLKNIHEAKEVIEINDLLGLTTSDELRELQDALNHLVEEYLVFYTKKGKYILLDNCPGLKIGKLSVSKKGFGFVILDKEDDLYVDAKNMNGAIHEDIVAVELLPKHQWVAPSSVVLQDEGQNEDDIEKEEERECIV